MKRLLSLVLVIALMLSIVSMLGVQSAAAVKIDTAYAQSCTNDFINFMKKKGQADTKKTYYIFNEKSESTGSESTGKWTYIPTYYYYVANNFIQVKVQLNYEEGRVWKKRTIILTIPGKYTGTSTINYDYSDNQGNTLQAKSVVTMATYDGTNASFDKTGGNSSDSQQSVNKWANKGFIIADNAVYNHGRTDTGIYSMGFCGMCESDAAIPRAIRATLTANGAKDSVICPFCALIRKTGTTIPHVQSVALSQTAVYYTGKVKTPTVTVKDTKGKTLKLNTDYSVSYASGRKAIGKYAVKVTFKGNYYGSKTLYFTINPGKPQISKITAGKKALALKWGKVNLVSGYQIQYATNSSFTSAKSVTAKGAVTVSKTLSSLTSGKRYYVRMRSYKATTYAGETLYIYSGWSTVKSVVVK
ncbi:MAG: hypothetical protein IJI67_04625 [Clostridia bacterium]|nr:hypothetical protein [Clostridia bacterium]